MDANKVAVHGHMTYSCEHTEEYVKLLKDIIKKKP